MSPASLGRHPDARVRHHALSHERTGAADLVPVTADANALVPLNADGLRPDVIPTLSVEYGFSAPWMGAR